MADLKRPEMERASPFVKTSATSFDILQIYLIGYTEGEIALHNRRTNSTNNTTAHYAALMRHQDCALRVVVPL